MLLVNSEQILIHVSPDSLTRIPKGNISHFPSQTSWGTNEGPFLLTNRQKGLEINKGAKDGSTIGKWWVELKNRIFQTNESVQKARS